MAGAAVVQTSAIKCKAEGKIVLREGDSSLVGCVGSWTLTAAPFTALACACGVEISTAGQNKVKAQ